MRANWDTWLALGLMLHTAGIFFCENGVIQNLWGAWLVLQTLLFRKVNFTRVIRETPLLRWLVFWMGAQFLLGFALTTNGLDAKIFLLRTWDLLFLPSILVLWIHTLRHEPRVGLWTIGFIALMGAVTAAVSFVGFYSAGGRFPLDRLMNQFVNWWWNDGFHPVLTGLTFGFAGLCGMLLFCRGVLGRSSWIALVIQFISVFAALFTHSRGAMLALVAGTTIAILACWGRRLVPAVLVQLLAAGLYFTIITHAATVPPDQPAGEKEKISSTSLVQRGDAGRFKLYRKLVEEMDSPLDWAIGRGLWASDEVTDGHFRTWAFHPHSMVLTMFVHHGVVGILFLGIFLGCAAWAALSLWRRGQPEWLVLLAYGCAGLIFDGHLLFSLTSIPRVEPLLVLFPATISLILGAGGGSRSRITD